MKRLTAVNSARHFLGTLCRRGHDWQHSGKSLRAKHNRVCLECKLEHWHRRKRLNRADRVRRNNLATTKFRLADPAAHNRRTIEYTRKKRKSDPYRALVDRLRGRVRRAFAEHTETGKSRTSREYGIDYAAIIAHLGPCPGDRSLYEVDHVRPLASFDLTDPDEVREAFAPKNHQWLPAIVNRRKGAKVSEQIAA